MDSIRTQHAPSSVATVQQYLSRMEPGHGAIEERSRVAQLCAECLFLFREMLKKLNTSQRFESREQKTAKISLQRSYGRLKIWSDEHQICDGGVDEALIVSWTLQRDALKLLRSIGHILTDSRCISGAKSISGVEHFGACSDLLLRTY